jgi:hypothetical protein
MKLFSGHFDTGRAAIAFPRATLLSGEGKPVRTDVQWWPIRRIWGFGGKRFCVALIRYDAAEYRAMEPGHGR